jgi:integrase
MVAPKIRPTSGRTQRRGTAADAKRMAKSLITTTLAETLRPLLDLAEDLAEPPLLRDVRDLHLGQVRERACLPADDVEHLAPTTVRTYEAAWAQIARLGALDERATEETFRAVVRKVARGNRNAFGGALSAAYHLARCGEAVPSRRLWAFKPPRDEFDLGDYLVAAKAAKAGLVAALERGRAAGIATAVGGWILVHTGARPRELVSTTARDVEHKGGRIRIRFAAKRATRWVPLARTAAQALELLPSDPAWLLPGRRDGRGHVSAHSITHLFERHGGPTPQQIRRLFASYLLYRGVPVHVVGALLGHAPGAPVLGVTPGAPVLFRHYARPFGEQLVEAVETVALHLSHAANSPTGQTLPAAPMQRIRSTKTALKSRRAAGGRR